MSVELVSELQLLLDELNAVFPPADCQRLRENLRAFELGAAEMPRSALQRARVWHYSGLPQKPWYEPSDYPELGRVAARLEQAYPVVRREYEAARGKVLLERYGSSDVHGLQADEWLGFTLWDRGRFSTRAREWFPATCAVVDALEPALFPLSGEVVFLRLKAGCRVPPHHDSTNAQVTCHLGLRIPSDCGMRVGNETRRWHEGKVLFFDHSFEHEVWNDSDQDRVVLLLNLVHPDLTPAERALLQAVAARPNEPNRV